MYTDYYTFHRFTGLGTVHFLGGKEHYTVLISKNALNWSKVTVKNIYNLIYFPQKYFVAQVLSTLIIIRNVSWATNQYIKMISEGSCNTERQYSCWQFSFEITGINYTLKYIKLNLNWNNIWQYYYTFDQLNATLMSMNLREASFKNKKIFSRFLIIMNVFKQK